MFEELLRAGDLYHCHLRIFHVSDTTEQALMDCTAITQIARFMRPTWGPSGADRTQVGPMLAP